MAAVGRRVLSLGLCGRVCCLILWYASAPLRKIFDGDVQTVSAADAEPSEEAPDVQLQQQQDQPSTGRPLFTGLDSDRIKTVSIYTPERTFQFQCSTGDSVSVNAYVADGDVFDTLVEQFLALAFEEREPFEPEGEPLLTVAVSTGTQQYNARFYEDAESGRNTNIISVQQSGTQYLTTEAWRVGTLLLTCEGTRIFDESGKETPVDRESSEEEEQTSPASL